MKAIAFSPAHITGFFQIFLDEDEKKAGSRGAGISLSLGSYAFVKHADRISISKKASVARDAIKRLGNFEVRIRNELPVSQGFGISGASALSAAMAACYIKGISFQKALELAHVAEVKHKSGLGDVVAAYHGGMEARIQQGLYGKIMKWNIEEKLLLLVAGKSFKTKDVLKNQKKMEKINDAGKECLEEFLKKPSFENFILQSKRFSEESGILNKKMLKILKKLNFIGTAAACMIGNSFFAKWDKKMKKEMMKYGRVYEAYVDNEGARIIAGFI